MKEWSDEELDKLFRKSAGEFEPPFEPDDWTTLRHRLDDADAAGAGWLEQARPWTIALLLLMIIGGISVYYGSSKLGEKRDTILAASGKHSPESSAPPGQLPVSTNAPGKKDNTEAGASGSIPEAAEGKFTEGSYQKAIQSSRIPRDRSADQRETIKELPRSLANVSGVRKQTDLNDQEGGEGAILLPENTQDADRAQPQTSQKTLPEIDLQAGGAERPATSVATNPEREVVAAEPVSEHQDLPDPQEMYIRRSRISVPEPLKNRPFIRQARGFPTSPAGIHSPAPDSTYVPAQSAAKVPRWAVRIGISPDMSFVNMKSMSRPGPAASMLIEHSLGQRWSLQAGIIRSLKIYNAQAGAYEWPSGWYQKQMPVSVDGSCQVFEIPLNARYDFSQLEKGRWFAGIGASSYKMQKEKYVYNYKTYDPTIRWWKWEGQTGWYLFSHANASIGYERLLTKKISIMAEPYIRIPLRGVGFGKVNLFSTGVWFSIRYAPVLRK